MSKDKNAVNKKPKAAKDDFDVKAWAKKAVGGNRCHTCADKPAAKAVKEALESIADGESEASKKNIWEMLVENYNYKLSIDAFYGHLNRCEKKLCDKIEKIRNPDKDDE